MIMKYFIQVEMPNPRQVYARITIKNISHFESMQEESIKFFFYSSAVAHLQPLIKYAFDFSDQDQIIIFCSALFLKMERYGKAANRKMIL